MKINKFISYLRKILLFSVVITLFFCNDQFSEAIISENSEPASSYPTDPAVITDPTDPTDPQLSTGWINPGKNIIPARKAAASVVYKNRFYIYGGEDQGMTRNDFWAYDLLSHEVIKLKSHTQLSEAVMFHASGDLYIFGGKDYSGQPVNILKKYNIVNDEWTVLGNADVNGSIPAARHSHAAAIKSTASHIDPVTTVYISGGEGEDGTLFDEMYSLKFTPGSKPRWKNIKPSSGTSPYIKNHGLAISGETVILFGGEGQFGRSDLQYFLNLEEEIWTESFLDLRPSSRSSAGFTSDSQYLYLFGGISDAGSLSDIWRYNISSGEWTVLSSGPGARSDAAAFMYDKFFVIFGGWHSETETYLGDLWIYDPDQDSLLQ